MKKDEFRRRINDKGILYLDGATGSNLYLAGMPRGVCSEEWILEHPQVLMDLQKAYADAGSDVVYAPTFGANRSMLASRGLDHKLEDMNRRLVDLSQRAVGGRVLIAGDVSPTGRVLESNGGDAGIDEVFEIYSEQIRNLNALGVDLIVVETMISLEETMVALDAAQAESELPVLCTFTVESDGSLIYGGSSIDAVQALEAMGASAVGINCSVGPDQLENVVMNLHKAVEIPIIAKPNAGLPFIDDQGNASYSMGADEFARNMKLLHAAGAAVIGGCCGTTPEYIRKTRLAMEGKLILP